MSCIQDVFRRRNGPDTPYARMPNSTIQLEGDPSEFACGTTRIRGGDQVGIDRPRSLRWTVGTVCPDTRRTKPRATQTVDESAQRRGANAPASKGIVAPFRAIEERASRSASSAISARPAACNAACSVQTQRRHACFRAVSHRAGNNPELTGQRRSARERITRRT